MQNREQSMSKYAVKEKGEFQYIDEGSGETILFLHGLFGSLSNWDGVIDGFSGKYRIIIPLLPIYTMPLKKAGINGLTGFVSDFINLMELGTFNIVGNSLGGHIGLVYTIQNMHKVKRLILTGSSGLFEDGMGGSFPRRGDYKYVSERVAYTFYDPKVATKDLIDDVFEVTNDNQKCLRMISIARSAQKHNMADELDKITVPTLLVWGLNDTITPPFVAHTFNRLIKNSTLEFVDKCGHAPMMEHAELFNRICEKFLAKTEV
jgi:pimeloyl-ACP methyl ester carboxylesterase